MRLQSCRFCQVKDKLLCCPKTLQTQAPWPCSCHILLYVSLISDMLFFSTWPQSTSQTTWGLYFPAPTWEKRLSCNSTNCDEPDKFRILCSSFALWVVDAHVAAFGRVILREPFVITCVCRPSLFAWSVLPGSWEVCRYTVFLASAEFLCSFYQLSWM